MKYNIIIYNTNPLSQSITLEKEFDLPGNIQMDHLIYDGNPSLKDMANFKSCDIESQIQLLRGSNESFFIFSLNNFFSLTPTNIIYSTEKQKYLVVYNYKTNQDFEEYFKFLIVRLAKLGWLDYAKNEAYFYQGFDPRQRMEIKNLCEIFYKKPVK